MIFDLKIHAKRLLWKNGIELHIGQKVSNDKVAVAQPLVMQTVDMGSCEPPCMVMDMQSAQLLMDELWHVGVRPTEGSGSVGQLAAVKYHLEDMRTIALSKIPGDLTERYVAALRGARRVLQGIATNFDDHELRPLAKDAVEDIDAALAGAKVTGNV